LSCRNLLTAGRDVGGGISVRLEPTPPPPDLAAALSLLLLSESVVVTAVVVIPFPFLLSSPPLDFFVKNLLETCSDDEDDEEDDDDQVNLFCLLLGGTLIVQPGVGVVVVDLDGKGCRTSDVLSDGCRKQDTGFPLESRRRTIAPSKFLDLILKPTVDEMVSDARGRRRIVPKPECSDQSFQSIFRPKNKDRYLSPLIKMG
jgi:hypothetical protein